MNYKLKESFSTMVDNELNVLKMSSKRVKHDESLQKINK